MSPSPTVLECVGLTKRYVERPILHDVHLSLPGSAGVCLRGSNGAGKTTLLRCVVGELPLDGGEVFVRGISTRVHPVDAKAMLGYAADDPFLYPYLTGAEHLRLWASLRGDPPYVFSVS